MTEPSWSSKYVLIMPTILDTEWCIYDRDDLSYPRETLCGRETSIFSMRMNLVPTPRGGIHAGCRERYDRRIQN